MMALTTGRRSWLSCWITMVRKALSSSTVTTTVASTTRRTPNTSGYLVKQGHQLASHTWAHAHLAQLTGDALNAEFTKTNEAITKITGRTPAFMRPPYGEYNDEVVETAASNGQTVVIWDFDSQDSIGATAAQSKSYYDDIINKNPGHILTLNHETMETTVHDVIPYALKLIKDKGYKMVTVAQCLGKEPYQATTTAATRDGSWTC
ncbi:carbohydrate esterase family 4 protein [Rhizoctonia solani AG-3 Rhs1AP]|uniref:Carbohydrate esterase family 4 protein n=1 Tax=Rhizoctonia solani AG-3 Rhs1AP TaxID=1086054 RepID=X8J5T2_9AGAM|nr:carbohydrate esterase family 4 protein [Rhizoctonia solani AG-3 Rhs1AP]